MINKNLSICSEIPFYLIAHKGMEKPVELLGRIVQKTGGINLYLKEGLISKKGRE